ASGIHLKPRALAGRGLFISPKLHARIHARQTSGCLQNTGGGRITPVAKYMARSGAIHRNHIKAASRNATMNQPIKAWSCVRRSRNHCNLSGIYPLSVARATKNALEQRSI